MGVVAASVAQGGLNHIRRDNIASSRVGIQNSYSTILWSPLSASNVKINFDGSVIGNSAAGGFVIRDNNSRPLFAAARNTGNTTVPVAEALALSDSLILAKG